MQLKASEDWLRRPASRSAPCSRSS